MSALAASVANVDVRALVHDFVAVAFARYGDLLTPLLASCAILFATTLALFRPPSSQNVSVTVPEPRLLADGLEQSNRIRHKCAKHGLIASPAESVKTVHDVLVYAANVYADNPCYGARKILRIHHEAKQVTKTVAGKQVTETKQWKYFELSPYRWISCKEALQQALAIGAGLAELGYNPGDKACLYAPTCPEWQLFAHGCFAQSLAIATAYDTLGPDGLLYSLDEPQIPLIFLHADLIPTLTKIVAKNATLRHVVYFGEAAPATLAALQAAGGDRLRIVTLDELKAMGTVRPRPARPPKKDDLCCIMYTSGSTGNPKGVMLNHSSIVAAVGGVAGVIPGVLHEGNMYLAFLPLAHILELVVETYMLFSGVSIGYGSPKTLTEASVRNCKGDIQELRPTVMAGVPVVWDSIKKGVLAKVATMSPPLQKVFWLAYKVKQMSLFWGLPIGWLADVLVFNKVKAQTGGRLAVAMSGGAPISEDTQLFLTTVICPIVQGYGMTEGSGVIAIWTPGLGPDLFGNVGGPMGCVEIKVVDVPEAGYKARGKTPMGEVWVRGPSVFQGYYNQPKLTQECLTPDGWLLTGDIGRLNPNGSISIIDRKKNLVKLAHGEYIALEKLESIYSGSKFVNRICVYADSHRYFPIAIVSPVPGAIQAVARAHGISYSSWEQLCPNKVIRAAILDDLKAVGKSNGFVPAEIVQDVIVADEEWTPENGLLTAAMKLKRREVVQFFKPQIDAAYKK
ncbi:long-chain fatty acid-CoA ligase [Allomyces arbusculus]|nr:long-chain fatty acid-CoA ligase [Allomyces arbusculus]